LLDIYQIYHQVNNESILKLLDVAVARPNIADPIVNNGVSSMS